MGYSNTEIAERVPMDVEAVGLWRRRWVVLQSIPLEGMNVAKRQADALRPGGAAIEPRAGVPDPGAGL
jgi:hypothetical protein